VEQLLCVYRGRKRDRGAAALCVERERETVEQLLCVSPPVRPPPQVHHRHREVQPRRPRRARLGTRVGVRRAAARRVRREDMPAGGGKRLRRMGRKTEARPPQGEPAGPARERKVPAGPAVPYIPYRRQPAVSRGPGRRSLAEWPYDLVTAPRDCSS
jgi:hypothetical protein